MMVKPLLVLVLHLAMVTCQDQPEGNPNHTADIITAFQHTAMELSRQMEDMKQFHKGEIEVVAGLQVTLNSIIDENKLLKARVALLESRLATNVDGQNEDQHNKGFLDSPEEEHLTSDIEDHVTNTASYNLTNLPPASTPGTMTGLGKRRADRRGTLRVAGTNRNAVAFYAFLSHNILTPGDDFTLKNNHPVTNLGGGYNPVSGIFTCPKSGVYVFSWAIGLGTSGQIYSELMKNGAPEGYLWTGEHSWAETSEKSVVLELAPGDVITIRVARTANTSPTVWALRTSFSGYLIPY